MKIAIAIGVIILIVALIAIFGNDDDGGFDMDFDNY